MNGARIPDTCPTCDHDAICHGVRGCMECSCIDFDEEADQ